MKKTISAALLAFFAMSMLPACEREPLLHLHEDASIGIDIPLADINLQALWNYDGNYDYTREWVYGWDEDDRRIFGEMGYTEPSGFEFRRFYKGQELSGPYISTSSSHVTGNHYRGSFDFGYYDFLVWSDIEEQDGAQALVIEDEGTTVKARTNKNAALRAFGYPGTKTEYKYYQPEQLFSCQENDVDMTDTPGNFIWKPELNSLYKEIDIPVQPVTYIYLTQIILHNNRGRISNIDGTSSLSAMASGVTLNTGITFDEAITVGYYSRLKNAVELEEGEKVDIIGGRVMTFGLCSTNPSKVSKAEDVENGHRHYMDVEVVFYNGMDSTLVFDVTDQVKRLYKGGVITVELDIDGMSIPTRPGGSGFDAVVKEPEEEIFEIEI